MLLLTKLATMLSEVKVAATGRLLKIVGLSKTILRVGAGAPTGTPDAYLYLQTDGTTTTTVLYADVNGTWTAITIS